MFQKCIEGTDHLAWPSGLMQANGDTARRSRRREKTSELARARAWLQKPLLTYYLLSCSGLMQAEGDYLSEK